MDCNVHSSRVQPGLRKASIPPTKLEKELNGGNATVAETHYISNERNVNEDSNDTPLMGHLRTLCPGVFTTL